MLWLDASHDASFTLEGDVVTAWASRVHDITFDNATADQRPTRVAAGLNDLPTVRFDGVDDNLFNQGLNLVGGADAYTVAVVFRNDAGTNGAVFFGVDDSNVAALKVQAETGPERVRVTHRDPDMVAVGNWVGAADGPVGDPLRVIARWDTAEFDIDALFADGTTEVDSTAVNLTSHGALNYVVGGSRPGDMVDGLDGDVAEILVFQRDLNAAEMEHLKGLLDAKWGF